MVLAAFSFSDFLLDDLVIIAIFVAIAAILIAGGRDPDASGQRVETRYLSAMCLLTLFITVFAGFEAVVNLTDLVVNHADRTAAIGPSADTADEAIFRESAFEFGDPLPLFTASPFTGNNQNYRAATRAGFIALAAGLAFAVHERYRRRLSSNVSRSSVVVRVESVYRAGVSFVAVLLLLFAVAALGLAVFRLIAPGVAGARSSSVGRAQGISDLLAWGSLSVVVGFILVRAWISPRELLTAGVVQERADSSTS
jgi:hypothetical protein